MDADEEAAQPASAQQKKGKTRLEDWYEAISDSEGEEAAQPTSAQQKKNLDELYNILGLDISDSEDEEEDDARSSKASSLFSCSSTGSSEEDYAPAYPNHHPHAQASQETALEPSPPTLSPPVPLSVPKVRSGKPGRPPKNRALAAPKNAPPAAKQSQRVPNKLPSTTTKRRPGRPKKEINPNKIKSKEFIFSDEDTDSEDERPKKSSVLEPPARKAVAKAPISNFTTVTPTKNNELKLSNKGINSNKKKVFLKIYSRKGNKSQRTSDNLSIGKTNRDLLSAFDTKEPELQSTTTTSSSHKRKMPTPASVYGSSEVPPHPFMPPNQPPSKKTCWPVLSIPYEPPPYYREQLSSPEL